MSDWTGELLGPAGHEWAGRARRTGPNGRRCVLELGGELRIVFRGGHAFGVADQEDVAEHNAQRPNPLSLSELRRLVQAARKAGWR